MHTWDPRSKQHHTSTPFDTTCNGSLHQREPDHSSIFIPPFSFSFLFFWVNYTTFFIPLPIGASTHHLLHPSKIKKKTFQFKQYPQTFQFKQSLKQTSTQNKHNPNCTKIKHRKHEREERETESKIDGQTHEQKIIPKRPFILQTPNPKSTNFGTQIGVTQSQNQSKEQR